MAPTRCSSALETILSVTFTGQATVTAQATCFGLPVEMTPAQAAPKVKGGQGWSGAWSAGAGSARSCDGPPGLELEDSRFVLQFGELQLDERQPAGQWWLAEVAQLEPSQDLERK